MRSMVVSLAVAAMYTALGPAPAQAFCGFYVASADAELKNNATMVVMMREGTKTVLSMQNDYQGPAEDFALVVPVPIVLREANVRTLPREVFDRVDTLAAPRLVEYWEQDPCNVGIGLGNLGTIGFGGGGGTGSGYGRGAGGPPLVTVEAEFAVGEYDIVLLGARDSSALDGWLREHGYNIPEGAGEVLRPYVEDGMKFFVAKVDVDRVTFENGRAILSPLRVWYDSDTFQLPVRLGLLNSSGTQDLVVHVLARDQRYEVANYPNVTIPTNLEVTNEARNRFGELYAALFDRTVAESGNAVVTEYAWQATNCDPCPGPVLSESDLMTLGADVILPPDERTGLPTVPQIRQGRTEVAPRGALGSEIIRRVVRRHINEIRACQDAEMRRTPALSGAVPLEMTIDRTGAVTAARATGDLPSALRECVATAARRWTFPAPTEEVRATTSFVLSVGPPSRGFGFLPAGPFGSFVLTRLHYRYSEDGLGEDLVFRAAEPIVGGREMRDPATGALEKDAQPAPANNFQGRYIIRHPWEGAIECDNPTRGIWGEPPEAERALAGRTQAATDTALVQRGNVDLGAMLKDGLSAIGGVRPAATGETEEPSAAEEPESPAPAAATTSDGGCGCSASGADAAATLLPLLLVIATLRRRR